MSVVIVNPSSAGGSTGAAWPQIASDLRSQYGAFRAVFTKHRGDATTLASDAARKGAKLVIACGGDGTISEVANGILSSGKDAELGILPSTAMVIRGDLLLTESEVVEDADEIEIRAVISGGAA